jgi:hypothetical protein
MRMTDAEQKAWDELVDYINRYEMKDDTSISCAWGDIKCVLAADAELKRLREAIEWACTVRDRDRYWIHDRCGEFLDYKPFLAELRRRAKEG